MHRREKWFGTVKFLLDSVSKYADGALLLLKVAGTAADGKRLKALRLCVEEAIDGGRIFG